MTTIAARSIIAVLARSRARLFLLSALAVVVARSLVEAAPREPRPGDLFNERDAADLAAEDLARCGLCPCAVVEEVQKPDVHVLIDRSASVDLDAAAALYKELERRFPGQAFAIGAPRVGSRDAGAFELSDGGLPKGSGPWSNISNALADVGARADDAGAKRHIVLASDGIESHHGFLDCEGAAPRAALRKLIDQGFTVDYLRVPTSERCPGNRKPAAASLCADLPRCHECDGTDPSCHERLPDATVKYRVAPREPDPFYDVVAIADAATWKCSGVFVANDLVLTAAHCLPAAAVLVGAARGSREEVLPVVSSTRHPTLDAALLRVRSGLERPTKPRRRAADRDAPSFLRHVGYGTTRSDGRGPLQSRKETDFTVTGWGCDVRRPETTGCRPGLEMVIPATIGQDTCRGDSGGPVFELLRGGDVCTWRLVAITSRRVETAHAECGSGGIYVRIDALEDWLDVETKRDGGR